MSRSIYNVWSDIPNKRLFGIVRVSSHRQKDSDSQHVQEGAIREYAKAVGLDVVEIIYIVESAKDSDFREKHSDAIERAITSGVAHIAYYMSDREARNMTDVDKAKKLIKAGLISIHYVSNRKVLWQGSASSDWLMRNVEAAVATQFSDLLSEKMRDSMLKKAKDGDYPGNRPPLGYIQVKLRDSDGREMKRKSHVVRDLDECKVKWVCREFELRANGLSFQAIRDQVVREGLVPARKVSSYRANSIEKRLSNPFYWGQFEWQGTIYPGKHELIIPPKVLKGVKDRVSRRGLPARPVDKQGDFSGGFFVCGHAECGRDITYDPKTKRNKETGIETEYRFYRCSNSRKIHPTMKGMYVTEANLWSQLENVATNVTLTKSKADQILTALRESNEKAKDGLRKQIADYKEALKKLEVREDSIYEDYKNGVLDESGYKRKFQRVREERDHYTNLLERANESVNQAFSETAESLIELAIDAKRLWKTATVEQRLALVKTVCSNQKLNGVTIDYELKKPFAVLAEMSEKEIWRPHGEGKWLDFLSRVSECNL
jgi:site-specific DNA recombinase